MLSQTSPAERATTHVIVARLRFEHLHDAIGIGNPRPRLSWITEATARDWQQSAYEIEAYRADGQLSARTGRVESGDSVLVPWPFAPLASREQLFVRVRVWGLDDESSVLERAGLGRGGLAAAERLDRELCDA